MRWVTGPSLTVRGAGGRSLRHYGRVLVALQVQENFVSLYFEVVDASRALLSVSAILDKGWRVNFDPDRPMIVKEAMKLHLERRGGLYLFEGAVQEVCDEQFGNYEVCDVMPIESGQAMDIGPVAEHLHEDVREQIPEAQPRELALPELPDAMVIRRHNLTHAEMASWCPVCVQARGRDAVHRAGSLEERLTETVDEIPLVQLDYTYIESLTILDLYVCNLRVGSGTVVEKKGAGRFPVQWVIKKLEQFGVGDTTIRTDAEHSIVAVAKAVASQRTQRTLLETAPEADHQAIGGVERYHRALQDQCEL